MGIFDVLLEIEMHKTLLSRKILFILPNEECKNRFKKYYHLIKDEDKTYILLSISAL